jgi:hypothetical protein
MNAPIRKVLLAACVAALFTPGARADSAVGNDTVIGPARAPGFPPGPYSVEPEWDMDDRSPTGLLYQPPRTLREPRRADGWDYGGWVDLGGYFGDESRAALYQMYRDLSRGAAIESFGGFAEKPSEARFIEGWGGNVGRDDQYYLVKFGRHNDWMVRAFYNETPHLFTSTYRSLWDGVGGSALTLSNPTLLVPGGAGRTAAQVAASISTFLATASQSELSVVRREGGARLEARLSETWRAFASVSSEKREGARPFGAVWGGGGGNNNLEIAETVDYTTHEIVGGVRFADTVHAFSAQVSASLFRNNVGSMTFQSPMAVAPAAGTTGLAAGSFTSGRFDLPPDNDSYAAKVEYARAMPSLWNGRFTALASYSSSRQDDELLPYLDAPGLVVQGVQGGQWNTTAALSQSSANARFDSALVDLALHMSPSRELEVKLRARYNETDNKTEYWACNPLTGQWGRVLNDGSGIAIVTNSAGTPPWPTGSQYCNLATLLAYTGANRNVPAAGNNAIRNIPWDYTQALLGATADWRLGGKSSLNALYEYEEMERSNRERERTREHRFKVGYANRALGGGTLRASAEYATRGGDTYVGDVYHDFLSASFGGTPATGNVASWIHVLASFRKYDLADRDQSVVSARYNLPLADTLDGALSGNYRVIRYPESDYGRNGRHRTGSINAELTWQPSPALSAFGFAGWQSGEMEQGSIWPAACTIGTGGVTAANFEHVCPEAGGPLFPLNRAWTLDSEDRNAVAGGGIRYDFGKVLADVHFTYTDGRTRIGYAYDPVGLANNINAAQQALAGSGMPELRTRQTYVEANVLVPISRTLSVRGSWRHERATVRDWHYDGVATTPTAGNVVYLDSGPQDYRVNFFGLFLRVTL